MPLSKSFPALSRDGRIRLILASLAFGLFLALFRASSSQESPPSKKAETFFKDRIVPLLKQHCLECHNPVKSKGSLDLSTRKGLLEGGDTGPAIAPGDAANSLLLKMIAGPEPKMPRQKPPFSAAQVADVKHWIEAGAAWPENLTLGPSPLAAKDWWAFKPLARPPVPPVKEPNWVHNPIDAFILARLENKKLRPSPETDRLTFIRRATFDLHGVPPTPLEIAEFLTDTSSDAFERLIDRLLASPRYGERWGRHWLDIVHYADTHGYDKDKRRLWAWLFRDWVIQALNRDMPYRRFVHYQLAGDVLFPEDPDGIVATGFIAAGPWDFVGHVELREGTVEKEKTRVLDRDDMVANTMSTFTSMTVHCARCHEHKFDPISQKEYYRLQAVFAGVERGDRTMLTPEIHKRRLRLELRKKENRARIQALEDEARAEFAKLPLVQDLDKSLRALKKQLDDIPSLPPRMKSPSNGYHSAIFPKPDSTAWVQVDLGKKIPLDEIALFPARPIDFPDTPGFGFPVKFRVEIANDAGFKVKETLGDFASEPFPNPGDQPVFVAARKKEARYIRVTATHLWERTKDFVFALGELQAWAGGKNLALKADVSAADSIEAGRWSKRFLVDGYDSRFQIPDLANPDVRYRFDAIRGLGDLNAMRERMANAWLKKQHPKQLKKLNGLRQNVEAVSKELTSLTDSGKVYTVIPRSPRPIHVLKRGEVEKKGELVTPGALSLLPGLDANLKSKPLGESSSPAGFDSEGQRRAALAHWITDDKNVLTWRSIVNRVWQYHFGKGLVDTPNDFGRNGSQPTHPELLDWLAVEFRDNGQSFKKLHRLIMLSATYRQSSKHHPEHAKIDGDNRYLWRMNRQRLDAESIRDSVLAVSGKMNWRMFGPGYDLFRFKDDHSPTYDHQDLAKIHDPATYRRTVYRFVVRSVPNPFLESLDCADPNINVPVRNTTLTALQALALLNNPFMVRQAEFFAERLKKEKTNLPGQIDLACQMTFGRLPRPEEREAVVQYARRHGLPNVCRVLLNANEFVFID